MPEEWGKGGGRRVAEVRAKLTFWGRGLIRSWCHTINISLLSYCFHILPWSFLSDAVSLQCLLHIASVPSPLVYAAACGPIIHIVRGFVTLK